jgi:hypothetical protein
MTLNSEHLFETQIISFVYQERPDSILWALRKDGKLLGFTINEAQEIKGWHYHDIAGGFVEAISISDDILYMVVKRTINGSEKRYVEYISDYFTHSETPQSGHYVDCGIFYNSTLTTTITGLNHLEGQLVQILANGSLHRPIVVQSGQIILEYAVTNAHIGLPYVSLLKTLSYEGGGHKGVSNGKNKRINRVQMQLYKSRGGLVSFANNDFEKLIFRTGADNMNQAVPFFTGIKDISIGNSYENNATITVKQEDPTAFNLLAVMIEMVTYER